MEGDTQQLNKTGRRSKRGREEPSTPGFFHHVRTTYGYHTGKLLKKWSHFTKDLTLAS